MALRNALCLLLLIGGLAFAGPRRRAAPADDRVALAGMLVREGDWTRADAVLDAIDPKAPGVDVARYWSLVGLVALHDQRHAEAAAAFQSALAVATEGRELIELNLARARMATADFDGAIAALDRAGAVGQSLPGAALLRAEAEERRGRPDAAWAALEDGAQRFPDQAELRRQQVFLLVRLGLFREARARGEALLARPDVSSRDAIAIAEALRQGGETAEALTILEAALLRAADEGPLLVQAARVALADGQPRNAARFLLRAAEAEPALYVEAAEAYRRAGDLEAALRTNGRVADPVAKARQRLGLLLESEDWSGALALEERLARLGLAGNDDIAYGLAFASFQQGQLAQAEAFLKGIADPEVFAKATALREAMAACAAAEGCP
jgi:tetratricopeptide (TPR) repeat protein